jgi:CheY-like chemotaxis protein
MPPQLRGAAQWNFPTVPPMSTPESAKPFEAPAESAEALTVLVVDDDREVVESLCELLQLVGYRTLSAYDGDDGVAVALRERPSVAILDLHMPRMGGVLACTRIRQQVASHDMKLVALTGSDQPVDREAAALAGFDHFLIKPVMVSALLHLLQPAPGGVAP